MSEVGIWALLVVGLLVVSALTVAAIALYNRYLRATKRETFSEAAR